MNRVPTLSYLTYSIVAVLGGNAAYAVGPSATPDFTFYAGGGSAEAQPVQAAFCQNFSNVDSYVETSAVNGTGNGFSASYLVLYGTGNSGLTGGLAGKNVLFIYKFNSGAYLNGAEYLNAAGGTLPYPLVGPPGTTKSILNASLIPASATTGTGTAGSACTVAQKGLPTYEYTYSQGSSVQPLFGITDLEVAAFAGINNPSGASLVTPVGSDLLYDLVFGVAVTNALYTGTSTTNAKTNFSRAEVAAILQGAITDWHYIYADNGQPVAPLHSGIILIDRNVGSGTKAAGSSYFLGYPGLGGNAKQPNSVTNAAGTGNNTGNGGSGNAPFNSGYSPNSGTGNFAPAPGGQISLDIQEKSSAAVVADLVTADQDNLLAIAILSADNPPEVANVNGSPAPGHYEFVKINNTAMDGNSSSDSINGTVGSSYINTINGSYDFFYQVNFNCQVASCSYSTSTPAGAFAASMLTSLKSASLAGVNTGSKFPVSTNGIILDGDRNSTLGKGVTVVSRGGNSSGLLLPVGPTAQPIGAIVTGNDPL